MIKIYSGFLYLLFNLILFLPSVQNVSAQTDSSASYITVVIPLRGREYWQDFRRVSPLFEFLKNKKIPVTVLIQYQNLEDYEVTGYLKSLPFEFELGLFLEVDETLANNSHASYLYGSGDRAHANKILLSGYEVAERKRMIDEEFNKFRNVFGFYPESVGVWYLDSLSQNYLSKNYGITAVLDVADQWNTDTYGLWGKSWGVPFIPSKFNSLIPFKNSFDDSGLVKIQWAARDPLRGFGFNSESSTYSVQANDYLKGHNLDIKYFSHLADIYLKENIVPGFEASIGQLTVGLEAGQEGNQFLDEFERQIDSLSNYRFVTMSTFARIYRQNNQGMSFIAARDYFDKKTAGYWFNFSSYRAFLVNSGGTLILKDLRLYDNTFFFKDMFKRDGQTNLKRIITSCLDTGSETKDIVLGRGINSLILDSGKNGYIMRIAGNNPKISTLVFSEDSIVYNKQIIFSPGSFIKNRNYLTENFLNLFLDFQTGKKSDLPKKMLFSRIDKHNYLGLSLTPELLLAMTDRPPYIGLFKFPYQTLSKFKSFDFDSFLYVFASGFVNPSFNCKIKL